MMRRNFFLSLLLACSSLSILSPLNAAASFSLPNAPRRFMTTSALLLLAPALQAFVLEGKSRWTTARAQKELSPSHRGQLFASKLLSMPFSKKFWSEPYAALLKARSLVSKRQPHETFKNWIVRVKNDIATYTSTNPFIAAALSLWLANLVGTLGYEGGKRTRPGYTALKQQCAVWYEQWQTTGKSQATEALSSLSQTISTKTKNVAVSIVSALPETVTSKLPEALSPQKNPSPAGDAPAEAAAAAAPQAPVYIDPFAQTAPIPETGDEWEVVPQADPLVAETGSTRANRSPQTSPRTAPTAIPAAGGILDDTLDTGAGVGLDMLPSGTAPQEDPTLDDGTLYGPGDVAVQQPPRFAVNGELALPGIKFGKGPDRWETGVVTDGTHEDALFDMVRVFRIANADVGPEPERPPAPPVHADNLQKRPGEKHKHFVARKQMARETYPQYLAEYEAKKRVFDEWSTQNALKQAARKVSREQGITQTFIQECDARIQRAQDPREYQSYRARTTEHNAGLQARANATPVSLRQPLEALKRLPFIRELPRIEATQEEWQRLVLSGKPEKDWDAELRTYRGEQAAQQAAQRRLERPQETQPEPVSAALSNLAHSVPGFTRLQKKIRESITNPLVERVITAAQAGNMGEAGQALAVPAFFTTVGSNLLGSTVTAAANIGSQTIPGAGVISSAAGALAGAAGTVIGHVPFAEAAINTAGFAARWPLTTLLFSTLSEEHQAQLGEMWRTSAAGKEAAVWGSGIHATLDLEAPQRNHDESDEAYQTRLAEWHTSGPLNAALFKGAHKIRDGAKWLTTKASKIPGAQTAATLTSKVASTTANFLTTDLGQTTLKRAGEVALADAAVGIPCAALETYTGLNPAPLIRPVVAAMTAAGGIDGALQGAQKTAQLIQEHPKAAAIAAAGIVATSATLGALSGEATTIVANSAPALPQLPTGATAVTQQIATATQSALATATQSMPSMLATAAQQGPGLLATAAQAATPEVLSPAQEAVQSAAKIVVPIAAKGLAALTLTHVANQEVIENTDSQAAFVARLKKGAAERTAEAALQAESALNSTLEEIRRMTNEKAGKTTGWVEEHKPQIAAGTGLAALALKTYSFVSSFF